MTVFRVFVVLAFLIVSAQARIFTDEKGRKIEAELLAVDGKNVRLKKGGKEFTLPISRFSKADQTYIRSWSPKKNKSKDTEGPQVELKPGGTLKFSFPELEKDFNGKPAAFSARIPKNYDPAKPVPLFIFLGGGKGNNSPGSSLSLTKDDFVCAGLPYPDSGRSPYQSNMVGQVEIVWNYWKPMLAKLEEAVPNLDPKVRIIGGFSNGAHAIDGLLGLPEFTSSFSAFVLIDGGLGYGRKAYRGAKDKHFYYAWGQKSPIAKWAGIVSARAKQGEMKIHTHEMKDTGHSFPNSEKEAVKSWLYQTVLPDLNGKPAQGR